MEQLKHYLRILKRQHFWALSGLVVLLCILAWFLTVRSLANQRDDFQQNIATSYSTVQAVRSKPDHVNGDTQEKMTQLIAERRNEVKAAWDKKYQQQTGGDGGENILKWPEELGTQFIRAVQKFRPIEQTAKFDVQGVDRDIATNLREDYRDYVKKELPKLADRIGAAWTASADDFGTIRSGDDGEEGPGGFGAGDRSARDSATIVFWNPDDQQFIQTQHFDWSTGYGKTPSSLQVLYAQEDLWVLTALVDIIKRTNGNATVRHNAAVKEIESIKIGKHAGGVRGQVRAAGAGEGRSADEDTGDSVSDEADYTEREESSEEGDDGPVQIDPADERYVDKNYATLPSSKLREAYTNEEDAYLQVAKRMPVRLRVKMDQRAINRLLVECANSPLTVEVRQVRVNPPDGTSSSTGLRGGLMGGRFGGESDFEGRGGLFGLGGRAQGPDMNADSAFPYDVTVEIYGIIYIYNPVVPSTLGDEADTDASYAAVSR